MLEYFHQGVREGFFFPRVIDRDAMRHYALFPRRSVYHMLDEF